MKILFLAAHHAYYRNFESVIATLAQRGHHVHLAADESESLGGQALVERLAQQYPSVTFGFAPSLDDEAWFRLARKVRTAADYVRFHENEFATFRKTRLTLRDRIPRGVLSIMDAGAGKSGATRRLLGTLLRTVEGAMPISDASRKFIEAQDPDVVLIASMTAWRLPQIDHLLAARALGRRTGVCVFSWDHLSSKALLRAVPDRILLWNETQKQEAIRWHGMPEERIQVTGAQCYDQWFGRQPSRDRATFCRAVGLPPDRPMLLYVCSVMTPNPSESKFVQRWIEEIRASADPALRNAGILVRPHPERMEEWRDVSLERYENVALYGRNPVSPQAQDDYFDSLYHSHAVIGLVTSAFLEAAIVGRPVLTPLLPEYEMYQEGVQHFRYLMEVEGGLLKVARTLPEHLQALSDTLARPVERDEQNIRFVRAFVRPAGLDVPATPAFVDAVEQLATRPALSPLTYGALHHAMQPVVHAVARSSEAGWLRPLLRDATELDIDRSRAKKAAHKQAAAEDRDRRVTEKREFLASRRRERQRHQWVGARRKQLSRIKGRLKGLVGSSS
jgi:predicted glycosyltransferase